MQKSSPVKETKPLPWFWNKRSRLLLLAAGASSLVVAVALFSDRRPIAVTVANIERAVPVRVYGLGTVEARVLSEIGFEVGAALAELRADHGDLVPKGHVLARLHSAEQQAKVAKARAGVVNAEAALTAARSAAARSKAILAQKEAINRRKQALLGRQVTSVEVAGEAEKEEAVARADVATAEANIEVAKAHLEDNRAQLSFETVLLEHHVLAAPYDALVVRRHKELGAVLKAGETVFTLIDPTSVWGLAYIDEGRSGEIQVGQRAEVRLRSRPQDMFQARVERIGIESDRVSEERRVYVKCEECPPNVHLGEQIEVFITTRVLEEGYLVPENSVQSFDGASGAVWTVESGRLRRRQLKLGPRTLDGRVVVRERLPEGVALVTSRPEDDREGCAARISGEPRP